MSARRAGYAPAGAARNKARSFHYIPLWISPRGTKMKHSHYLEGEGKTLIRIFASAPTRDATGYRVRVFRDDPVTAAVAAAAVV